MYVVYLRENDFDMKRFLVFFIALFVYGISNAAVNLVCKVQYETRYGWSDPVKAEVTFATGSELNSATRSYDFKSYEIYVTIWFSQNECAIIELDTYTMGIGTTITYSSIESLFLYRTSIKGEQVNTSYKIRWQITAKDFMGFIDDRL